MSAIKSVFALTIILSIATFNASADEVSKKACIQFLPALGDNNIDLINNGMRRDYPENDKPGKKLAEILKIVGEDVNQKTQERCDKGSYPIMDVGACYDKCKSEVAKQITGSFAWNNADRAAYTNLCYNACTGAYVAQNAITKTLRKSLAEDTQCGSASPVFDSRKAKQVDGILQKNSTDDKAQVFDK